MSKFSSRLFACLIVTGLAGCATVPEIPFDHASNPNIKTIGLLEPSMSPTGVVWLASDIGQSMGLIGALVDAGMQANRDSKFESLLAAQGVKPQDVFVQDVHAALAAHGYTVTDIHEPRPSSDLLKTYPKGGDGTDAYLDIVVYNYGYVASGIGNSTPYRPFFAARCRLVRASDGAVLMQDAVVYNPVGPASKVVTISPDPAYQFTDFDALMADAPATVKGLNAAFAASANAVGTLVQ